MDIISDNKKSLINYGALFIILISSFFYNYRSKSIKKINWDIYKITREDLNPEKYLFSEIGKTTYKNQNNQNKDTYKTIIGIDFGSAYSGFSYTFEKDISKIKSNKKIPSDIILSKELQHGLINSNSASVTMMNYNQKELRKILYISSIKSIIESKNETINDNLCYYYPNYIYLNITNDLCSFFTMLKSDIMKEIKESNNHEILWIISIPSNWDEFQKQIMIKSLKTSDINNIKLIYESDAISLSAYNDKYIDNKYKKKNNVFLLIDFGASSVSFTVNKFEDNKGTINQIFTEVKNDIGTNYIVEEIINIFVELLGEKNIENIKVNYPGDWIKFLKEINKVIENTFNINGIEIFEITNIFNKNINVNFIYDNLKYNINFNKKENKIKLNYFILTGGFSQNKIIKNELDKYAEDKSLSVQTLSSYQNAISKGCVIYGINPNNLLTKKSPITLGIYNYIKKEMEILIKKNEEIKNEIILEKYIKPQLENQKIIQIFVYLTDIEIKDSKELKKYLFGRVLIKLNKNIEKIKLLIQYDTYLNFSAIDSNGKENIKTEFQFFSNNQIKLFAN